MPVQNILPARVELTGNTEDLSRGFRRGRATFREESARVAEAQGLPAAERPVGVHRPTFGLPREPIGRSAPNSFGAELRHVIIFVLEGLRLAPLAGGTQF